MDVGTYGHSTNRIVKTMSKTSIFNPLPQFLDIMEVSRVAFDNIVDINFRMFFYQILKEVITIITCLVRSFSYKPYVPVPMYISHCMRRHHKHKRKQSTFYHSAQVVEISQYINNVFFIYIHCNYICKCFTSTSKTDPFREYVPSFQP